MVEMNVRDWEEDELPFNCPVCVYYESNMSPVYDKPEHYFCSGCGGMFLIKKTAQYKLMSE